MSNISGTSNMISCNLVLAPNDYFGVYVYQNDTVSVYLGGLTVPNARVVITRLL